MEKTYITNKLWNVAALVMVLSMCMSCMKDDETVVSPECAIISFSVGSITSYVPSKKYDSSGNATDTIVSKTITGSEIFFNIDQVNRLIYNVDSLPKWTDLTRIVPTFDSYGTVFVKLTSDNLYYRLTSGTDSIDFSNPVELLSIASNGISQKSYKVEIRKHVESIDTLEWKSYTTNLGIKGQSKLLTANGKVFAFAKNSEGKDIVTYANSSDATQWSTPAAIPVDKESVVLFGNNLYGLGSNGYIYRSTPDQLVWTQASNKKVERLLAADSYYIYALDGDSIIGSEDLNSWTAQGTNNLNMLPETSVQSFSFTSNTNSSLQVDVMTGISSNNSRNGVTWYKLTSPDSNVNQPWEYIQVTNDNVYGLPHLDNLAVTSLDKTLYAIGANNGCYEYIYRSDDSGITWHPLTEMYPVPSDLKPENGAASIVTVGRSFWIVQENGKIWSGSIR